MTTSLGQLGKKTVGKEAAKQASDKIWIYKYRFVPSLRIIKARRLWQASI